MVRAPRLMLKGTMSASELRLGDPHTCRRIEQAAQRYRSQSSSGNRLPAVCWEVAEGLQPHSGLGSGTQLGMAVATILSRLAGEANVSGPELAYRVGRGARSAIGVHGFCHGGFLIEGGKRAPDTVSPLVARFPVPEEWRWVLIHPRGVEGLSGAAELQGFSRLPPMPAATTDRLCRLALLDMAPALAEAEFEEFSKALHAYGQIVGEYFAPVQGGVFADARMRDLAPRLRTWGVKGFGQTSWGPTLFALCPDAGAALCLSETLSRDPAGTQCEITIAETLNAGASVEETRNP